MTLREPPLGEAGPDGLSAAMAERRREAAEFLKTLGHEGRLMILCHLAEGERSVTELEALLDSRQSAVSQQLARLRMEGLVAWRREGKAIHYTLADPRARVMLEAIHMLFRPEETSGEGPAGGEGRP